MSLFYNLVRLCNIPLFCFTQKNITWFNFKLVRCFCNTLFYEFLKQRVLDLFILEQDKNVFIIFLAFTQLYLNNVYLVFLNCKLDRYCNIFNEFFIF